MLTSSTCLCDLQGCPSLHQLRWAMRRRPSLNRHLFGRHSSYHAISVMHALWHATLLSACNKSTCLQSSLLPTCPVMPCDPSIVGHVSNGVLVCCQPLFARGQVLVNNAIQPFCLICIPFDAILNLLWSVSYKMVCLALHRSNASLHCVADSLSLASMSQFYCMPFALLCDKPCCRTPTCNSFTLGFAH